MAEAILRFTVGPPGSGKSFALVREIIDFDLPQTESTVFTNLPLEVEEIAEHMERIGRVTRAEIFRRLHIIPEPILTLWAEVYPRKHEAEDFPLTGPWDYFAGVDVPAKLRPEVEAFEDKYCDAKRKKKLLALLDAYEVPEEIDLEDAKVCFDECDKWVGLGATNQVKQSWLAWVSELRHAGMKLDLLVQDAENVYKGMMRLCQNRRYVDNQEDVRDPFFGIMLKDWYELRAAFLTGKYRPRVVVREERRRGANRWEDTHSETYTLEDKYFKFYNSYNNPTKMAGKGVGSKKYEFQRRSRVGLVRWFLSRNFIRVGTRFVMFLAFMWCFFGGGFQLGLREFMSFMKVGMQANRKAVAHAQSVPASSNDGLASESLAAEVVAAPGSIPAGPGISPPVGVLQSTNIGQVSTPDSIVHSIPPEYKSPVTSEFLKVTPETDGPITLQKSDVADMFGKVEELTEINRELEADIQRRKAEIYLTVIMPNRIVFSDGSEFRQRDRIDVGPFEGLFVYEIDYKKRRVRLSNGEYLRPGLRSRSADTGGVTAGLSQAVRGVSGAN